MRGAWYAGGALAAGVAVSAAMLNHEIGIGLIAVVICVLVPRRLVIPGAAMVVIALMLIFPVQYLKDYGNLSRLVLVAAPAVTALAFARAPQKPRSTARVIPWLLLAYGALLVGSTALHSEIANSTLLTATLVPAGCAFLLIVATDVVQRVRIEQFVVIAAAAESLYAIVEVARGLAPLWRGGAMGLESQIIPGLTRSQGTLGHPLPLALTCVTAIGLLLARRYEAPRAATIGGITLLAGGIVASGSRSALAIVAILLAFSIGRRAWSVVTIAVLAVTLGAASLAAAGFFQSATYLNFIRGDSLSHRSGALSAVPRLLDSQDLGSILFGNGYFSAPYLFARGLLQQGNFYAIDNQLVTSLVEVGMVGMLLLVALSILCWSRAGRYRLLVVGLVAFFFTFDILSWPSAATLFCVVVALVARGSEPLTVAGDEHQLQRDGRQGPVLQAVSLMVSAPASDHPALELAEPGARPARPSGD